MLCKYGDGGNIVVISGEHKILIMVRHCGVTTSMNKNVVKD